MKQRGRPKMKQSTVVRHHILLDDDLKELLDSERKPNERYNDTMRRMLYQKGRKIGELQKKVDALLEQRHQFQYTVNHNYDREPNELLQVRKL